MFSDSLQFEMFSDSLQFVPGLAEHLLFMSYHILQLYLNLTFNINRVINSINLLINCIIRLFNRINRLMDWNSLLID